MKDFKRVKTIQLVIMLVLTCCILIMIFKNSELYHTIATTEQVGHILFISWLLLAVCFAALIYDFTVYAQLKRKYGELDMAMYQDSLTGIGNRSSLDAFIDEYSNKELPEGIGSVTFTLSHMAEINKEFGNIAGDEIIKDFSNILSEVSKGRCFVGRNGGNQFLALFKETTEADISEFIEIIKKETNDRNNRTGGAGIVFKYGIAVHNAGDTRKMNELVASSFREATGKKEDDCGIWKN